MLKVLNRARPIGQRLAICLPWLLLMLTSPGMAQGAPDFEITTDSILFSNPNPVEGESIVITLMVRNVGNGTFTMNEELEAYLFEGDPDENPLRIKVSDLLLSDDLEPGKSGPIQVSWHPRAGTTVIHAIVNPTDSPSYIESEVNRANNHASRAITASARQFPRVTPEQIEATRQRGIEWLLAQQGEHIRKCPQDGTINRAVSKICQTPTCLAILLGLPTEIRPAPTWHFGESQLQETSIALLALLSAGVSVEHPQIEKALDYVLNEADWSVFTNYDFAVLIPALVATGRRDAYYTRVEFAVKKLIASQLLESKGDDARDDGGWGYGHLADGAHMQYVLYALYTAKHWGVPIPDSVWEHAEAWVRRQQYADGGWLYNLVESQWAEGTYGSMTGTGLMALKVVGVFPTDPQFRKGVQWLQKYWTLTSNPGSYYWRYYYLLALERAFDMPPQQKIVAGHDWYQEIADMLVAEQDADGSWQDVDDRFYTTCFAVLLLSRALPQPETADLSVVPDSIQVAPPSPREGDAMVLTTSFANLGKPTEAIVPVHFYDGLPEQGGERIGQQDVLFTVNRPDTVASLRWKAGQVGEHRMVVVVDPEGSVPDANRSNNRGELTLKIRPVSAEAVADPGAIRKIEEGLYQIGKARLDTRTHEVRVPGQINMSSGKIEYFACGLLGKTHESLLVLDVSPIHLQIALVMLGLKSGQDLRPPDQEAPLVGDKVDLWVEWEYKQHRERHRAEELILDWHEGAPMQKTPWIFTGARTVGGIFTASMDDRLVATYRDPDAILNHPLPGGIDDERYEVNTAAVPVAGTPVTLIITPSEM